MVTAKCTRCLGSAEGSTFEEASSKINHAVALSRGVKCGRNYNQVFQVDSPKPAAKPSSETVETKVETTVTPKPKKSKPKKE